MEFKYDPEASHAFHWERDVQHMVGHVKQFTVAGTDLAADITLTNPTTDSGAPEKVVGALDEVNWNGKPGGELELKFVVSTGNRRELLLLLHQGSTSDQNISGLENAAVSLQFVIYDYDPEAAEYFKAFFTGTTAITGKIKTGDGESVMETQEDEVKNAREALTNAQVEKADEAALKLLRETLKREEATLKKKKRDFAEAKAKGNLEKTIELSVSSSPEADPLSPQVWMVTVKIMPPEQSDEESIHFAVAVMQPIVKAWGFKPPTESST